MNKRHFIVFYKATASDGDVGCGYCSITSSKGYLNSKGLNAHVLNDMQAKSIDKKVNSVCITNIIELNEEDYKSWSS